MARLTDHKPKKIWFNKPIINIFVDCETYYEVEGLEYGNTDEVTVLNALRGSTVIPWLIAWRAPKLDKEAGRYIHGDIYETGWSCEYPHPKFVEMLKYYYSKGFTPMLWFHNAAYDLDVMIPTLFKEIDPENYCYRDAKTGNKNFLSGGASFFGGKLKIKFGDTLLYKNISIAAIGKMFNAPKGEIPYTMANLSINRGIVEFYDYAKGVMDSVTLKECVDYITQDVFLTQKYYFELEEQKKIVTKTINGKTVKGLRDKTQAGHAKSLLDLYLHRVAHSNYRNLFRFDVSKEEYEIQHISKKGGFTSRNKFINNYYCKPNELITSFDCNSMYPSIMREGLPCGPLVDEKPPTECVEWVLCTCTKAKWGGIMDVNYRDPLPQKEQTGKPFYIERETLEFIKANLSEDSEITELGCKYQGITYHVGGFIDLLFNLRLDLKQQIKFFEGDDVGEITRLEKAEQGVKTNMNSQYGKFCEDMYLKHTFREDSGFFERIKPAPVYQNMTSGVYISDRSRLKLYKKIKQILEAGFTFLYSDTDSVKFAYPKDQAHKLTEIFENPDLIGGWKNEGTWHEYHNCGTLKKYLFVNNENPAASKFTLSGVKETTYLNGYKNKLIYKPDEALKELRYIFNDSNNVVFINAKNRRLWTHINEQPIIVAVHVQTNPTLRKVTAECIISEDQFPKLIYA